MSHASDVSMPHTGGILGARYILRERIGAGGMGRVFRARDEVLARDVAIKIFHTDGTGEPEPLRRMSEARTLAALNHPSLVTLYDARLFGEEHVYLVMELITGPSLQQRIEQVAIGTDELAGILVDLAGALAVVHDAGIVHRDVKPSNVLLRPLHGATRDFEAVLADFGVARLIDATRLTTPGTVIGTAAYLAPEQVRGEAPQAASDIYALGLLAIEALTRLHPFGVGSLQETLLARLARQPEVPGSLSPGWRALLTEMTAADTAERPTAAIVAARAAELMTDESAVAAHSADRLAGWMTPTAPITAAFSAAASGRAAVSAPPADRSGGSAEFPSAAAIAAPASEGGAATSPPAAAIAVPGSEGGAAVATAAAAAAGSRGSTSGVASVVEAGADAPSDERTDATTSRRATGRRPRRRGWAWVLTSVGAALIVGVHLAALPLGAAEDATSDRAPAAVTTSTPEATDAPVSTRDDSAASPEPVVETSSGEDATPQPSPEASAPVQPAPVIVDPAAVVSNGAAAGGAAPDAETGGALPPGATDPATGADAGIGRGALDGKGRPDAPGKSEDAGKGRGTGPSGKG